MIAALVRFIQEWKRYNRSLNELSRLGDRELADIGISRSDIPRVAWNAAQRSEPTTPLVSSENARGFPRAFRLLGTGRH